MTENRDIPETDMREQAVTRLRKRGEFRTHLLAYLLVNTSLVIIWAATGVDFFWPMFPMLGWGIGLVFHALDVYGTKDISEADIQRELERMK